MPDCLVYAGDAPTGWVLRADRVEMRTDTDWGPTDAIPGGGTVGTDGNSRHTGSGD